MTLLVTGSTGLIGSNVVALLAAQGTRVRALTRSPEKARFPSGVEVAKGDFLDVASMRAAMAGVRTLFLLNTVAADEITQALIALNLAREAGIDRIVYLSVMHSDRFTEVPHFTGKHTVERMIEQFGMHTTVLRAAYFMQNDDALVQDDVLERGVYPMPIGGAGIAMVDARDVAQMAVHHLLRRHAASEPLPSEVLDIVGPETLSGEAAASVWSEVLGKPVCYAGDDIGPFAARFKTFAPDWMAYDMRLMVARMQRDGEVAGAAAVERMQSDLGGPLRSYRAFVQETVARWRAAQ
ncbi:MAG: NmrA family NAD(P)-binding protein [Burkholderiaceae bacterium]